MELNVCGENVFFGFFGFFHKWRDVPLWPPLAIKPGFVQAASDTQQHHLHKINQRHGVGGSVWGNADGSDCISSICCIIIRLTLPSGRARRQDGDINLTYLFALINGG